MAEPPILDWTGGDTLVWDGVYVDGNDIPVDATNVVIASQFRRPNGTLLGTAVITKKNQSIEPGGYTGQVETAGWPLKELIDWDIKAVEDGIVGHTDKWLLRLSRSATA